MLCALAQTSAVQVFLAVINLILATQRSPCSASLSVCLAITLAICILMLEARALLGSGCSRLTAPCAPHP
jgi:uncharacterized membrane protein YwaF